METKDEWKVGGFMFGSEKDAKLARQELDKISFLEKRINYDSPENVLTIYNRTLEKRIFQTPVGYQYLQGLQEYLKEKGLGEQVAEIPLYQVFGGNLSEKMTSRIAKKRVQPSEYKELRRKLRLSIIFNLLLLIMVIAMFIVALTGRNPTILNYEKRLTDRYAGWEQELTEREKAVRAKERSLNME